MSTFAFKRRLLTVCGLLAVGAAGLVGPASAAPSGVGEAPAASQVAPPAPSVPDAPSSASGTQSGSVSAYPTGMTPAAAEAAGRTIHCTPGVQNPHNSSHVNGTVNVVVTLKCTSAVPFIGIRAALYKNGKLVKDSGQKNFYNKASAQNNAAVRCSNGTYQGWGAFAVEFPAGYQPPTASTSGFGNAVRITC